MINDPFRTGRVYTIGEAARLADTHPTTARRWLQGIAVEGRVRSEPVFHRGATDKPWVSFLELAELVIVARYRKENVPLKTLRRAHRYASEKWDTEYPFAHLKMARMGRHVLCEFREAHPTKANLTVLDQDGQYVLPGIVADEYLHFDFDDTDQLAIRWYPYGRDVPIVVDPHFGAGRPTVPGRGVRIETLKQRNKAGQDPESLAVDFLLDIQTVKMVLEHAA